LKQGAAHYAYGDFLDRMLIEQLLHGLESREICDEIIAKKPATFAKAYEIAQTLEATRYITDEVKTAASLVLSEQTYNKLRLNQNEIRQEGYTTEIAFMRSKATTQLS